MKLNIGDYVRLDRCQGINRIEEYDEDIKRYKLEDVIGDEWGDETFILDENDVIKSSPNIIDLIEVGDYVNGLKVSSVGGTYHGRKDKAIYCDYCENKETGKWAMIYDDEIKSIVTKEQFSQMEYKIGEQYVKKNK